MTTIDVTDTTGAHTIMVIEDGQPYDISSEGCLIIQNIIFDDDQKGSAVWASGMWRTVAMRTDTPISD